MWKIFLEERKIVLETRNLLGRLVHLANTQTKNITFPSCHDIKTKLLKSFFNLRLHIYAKKQENIRKTRVLQGKTSELGSKRMMMRKTVMKIGKQ